MAESTEKFFSLEHFPQPRKFWEKKKGKKKTLRTEWNRVVVDFTSPLHLANKFPSLKILELNKTRLAHDSLPPPLHTFFKFMNFEGSGEWIIIDVVNYETEVRLKPKFCGSWLRQLLSKADGSKVWPTGAWSECLLLGRSSIDQIGVPDFLNAYNSNSNFAMTWSWVGVI